MAGMEIEYSIALNEVWRLNLELLRVSFKAVRFRVYQGIIYSVLSQIFLLAVSLSSWRAWLPSTKTYTASAMLLAFFSSYVWYVYWMIGVAIASRNPLRSISQRLTADDRCLSHYSDYYSGCYDWRYVTSVKTSKHYLFLMLRDRTAIAVPAAAFPTSMAYANFVGLVVNLSANAKLPQYGSSSADENVWPPSPRIDTGPSQTVSPRLNTPGPPLSALDDHTSIVAKVTRKMRVSFGFPYGVIYHPMLYISFIVAGPSYSIWALCDFLPGTTAISSIWPLLIVLLWIAIEAFMIRKSYKLSSPDVYTKEISTDFHRFVSRGAWSVINIDVGKLLAVHRNPFCIFVKTSSVDGDILPIKSFPSKAAANEFYFKMKDAIASRKAELKLLAKESVPYYRR